MGGEAEDVRSRRWWIVYLCPGLSTRYARDGRRARGAEGVHERSERPTTKLRRLLARPVLICGPGCYDPLTARIIESAGFECIYMSGGSFAAAHLGAPDLALTTMTELATGARNISLAVEVPVIG